MVNAIVQPIFIVKKVQENLNWLRRLFVGSCAKNYHIRMLWCVILSVERFVTLAFSLIIRISLSLAWSIILLLTISHHLIPSIVHFHLAAAYLSFCITTIVIIRLWIQRLILRHKRQILQQQSIEAKTRQKVLSTTKTSYVLITILLVCYFPSIVTNLYTLPNGSDFSLHSSCTRGY